MSQTDYYEARKLAKKEYKYCVSLGRSPYLPVLDEILSNEQVITEEKVGLVNIPLDFIVGTATAGRTTAFAANFMPVLGEDTEFAFKWSSLADAQVDEGIRDPIIVYEYMNRYYVVEGNKRVSVMKFFQAFSIPAIVTRKLPTPNEDEPLVKLYYEYLDFNKKTGFNTIEFSVYGSAEKILNFVNAPTPWDEDEKEKFNKFVFLFTRAFNKLGGEKLNLKLGDGIAAFLNVYGYADACEMDEATLQLELQKSWNEIANMAEHFKVDLVMEPAEIRERRGFISRLISETKECTVAFLYPKSPDESDWIYGHELGRNYLEETFHGQIKTIRVDNVTTDNVVEVLEDVIEQGATIIFEVAPQLMVESLKVAIDNPKITILNCSLNMPHKYIRTYYARMYEAKFLAGMLAGAIAENDKIAYIADYPIFGMIANINAFAFGAQCVNPRAKVYLDWSTRKNFDLENFCKENDIHVVSDQDMITPTDPDRGFGLYAVGEDIERVNLLLPVWNWGVFYEKLIHSILSGTYDSEEWDERRPLNYWWGMSAGVIDLITSKHVPSSVASLIEHIKRGICSGDVMPFQGEIHDQSGARRAKITKGMKPEEIMNMDWLSENIIGELPSIDELIDGAKDVVVIKGVE